MVVSRKALELDQILTDKNNSDDEIDEKSPAASIFNVQNPKMNYKNETRRCFNCGIQGHLKATCRKEITGIRIIMVKTTHMPIKMIKIMEIHHTDRINSHHTEIKIISDKIQKILRNL